MRLLRPSVAVLIILSILTGFVLTSVSTVIRHWQSQPSCGLIISVDNQRQDFRNCPISVAGWPRPFLRPDIGVITSAREGTHASASFDIDLGGLVTNWFVYSLATMAVVFGILGLNPQRQRRTRA